MAVIHQPTAIETRGAAAAVAVGCAQHVEGLVEDITAWSGHRGTFLWHGCRGTGGLRGWHRGRLVRAPTQQQAEPEQAGKNMACGGAEPHGVVLGREGY